MISYILTNDRAVGMGQEINHSSSTIGQHLIVISGCLINIIWITLKKIQKDEIIFI